MIFFIHNGNYIMSCYLFKGLIFLAFTSKLMLLFIMMNMSNSRVYFMKQNVSTLDGKVSTPAKYAITPHHARRGHPRLAVWPLPIATRPCILQAVHAHHDPSIQSRFQSLPINHPSVFISILLVSSRLLSMHIGTSPRPQVAVHACLGPV